MARDDGQMGRFEHGGDIWTHPGMLDFSANLNPLGMPKAAVDALRASLDAGEFEAYPDPRCTELVDGIARAQRVPPEWVLATAGATDLMSRVCLALHPERVLVTAPCYSGYEQALEQAGASAVRYPLRASDGFELDAGILDAIDGTVGLVIVASPNNPTGLVLAPQLVERIAEKAAQVGTVVLLDECFAPFCDAPSCVPLCAGHSNLVTMRAFTKIYAMAGLRLGYGICSDAALLARIAAAGQPWAVSMPAQVAGLAALREDGFLHRTRASVAAERARLSQGLAGLGYRVIPGQANYLLFDAGRDDLYARLLERGILIRRCGNYEGLGATWYRTAVRTEEENGLLLAALRAVEAGIHAAPVRAGAAEAVPGAHGAPGNPAPGARGAAVPDCPRPASHSKGEA